MVYSIFFSTSVYVSFITIATKHAMLKCMGIKDAKMPAKEHTKMLLDVYKFKSPGNSG